MLPKLIAAAILLTVDGVSAIRYIDYASGSNSNDGLTTSTAWTHSPGMVGCTSVCASYTPTAGDTFVFKGGVMWPSAAMPLTIAWSGSAGNLITFRSDTSWFTGSAWARPVLDGEYSVAVVVNIGLHSYLSIDGLEMKRVSSSASFNYGVIYGDVASHHVTMNNLYVHGWRTTNVEDDAHGGVIFSGTPGSQVETIVLQNSEIDNLENVGQASWGRSNGLAAKYIGRIFNTRIHDVSSAVLFTLEYDSNVMYNVSQITANTPGPYGGDIYHANGVYLDCETLGKSTCYIRNSTFYDIGPGANASYLNGRHSTIYNYNNVYYGTLSNQRSVGIDPYDYGLNETSGIYYVYNNTCRCENSTSLVHVVNRGGAPQPAAVIIRNNHVIGTGVSVDDNGPSASYIRSNNLIQTESTANGQGYSGPGWNPSSVSGATVDAGFDGSSIFSTDKLGLFRPLLAAWDIGAYECCAVGSISSGPITRVGPIAVK